MKNIFGKITSMAAHISILKLVCILALCLVVIWGVFQGTLLGFAQDASGKNQESQKKTKIYAFGYDIFRALPEPITEGPVDEEYLLSPGDEIIVAVWGQLNLKYPLTVSEDGYIDIPDEGGRVFTNGVSLKKLKRLIAESLSQIYSSYINLDNPAQSLAFVDVKLAKTRKMLVYMVGEVKTQGVYTISSSVATLLNLLNNAGGVKETGSLRKIKIRRAGGRVDVVDLYDFLITGKIDTRKTRIMFGDYIIVPLKGKSVTIKGEIKRPGIYELIGNEGIKDLIQFAGGLISNAYLKRSQIRRFEINIGEKFIDLDLESIFNDSKRDFALMDGDEVTIFPNVLVRRRLVEIQGEGIKRPGVYEYRPGMTLKDLIEQAEGLKEYVYLERADLLRTGEDFSKRLTIFSLKDLYKEEEPGHYVYTGNEEKNFELKEIDRIIIYSSYEMRGKDKHITLEGHFKEPGTYILAEDMSLYDLIFSRGGFRDVDFKKDAFLEVAHIFRKVPGELKNKVLTFNLGELLEGNPEQNIPLEDSDRIVIYSYKTLERKPVVNISGLIKRGGTYTLSENMTLGDLILVAGGLPPNAYKVEAVIARKEPHGEGEGEEEISTIVVPIELDIARISDEVKTPLKAYDRIVIRNLPEWEPLPVVSVEGQVKSPGSYSLERRDERISSLLRRAGGFKKGAFIEGAYLFRRKDIVKMSEKGLEGRERITINLKEALKDPRGPYDLVLKDGDRVFIPHNPGCVEVRGAVRRPSVLQYRESKRVGYYIKLCGGCHENGDKYNIVIYYPSQEARKVKKFLVFRFSPKVLPGSIINVPVKVKKEVSKSVETPGEK